MSIHQQIQAAYPGASPIDDYRVQDDGAGPYLAAWNIAGPIPAGVRTMAAPAIAVWEAELRAVIQGLARDIVKRATALGDYAHDNDIADLIAAAATGELVEGATIRKEDAALRHALLADLQAWLAGQATGAPEGVTRRRLINGEF